MVLIHQQRKGQIKLCPELFVAFLTVGADAEDYRVLLLKLSMYVTESTRLCSATWRVVLGVKVEYDFLSSIVGKIDCVAAVCLCLKGRGGGAGCKFSHRDFSLNSALSISQIFGFAANCAERN